MSKRASRVVTRTSRLAALLRGARQSSKGSADVFQNELDTLLDLFRICFVLEDLQYAERSSGFLQEEDYFFRLGSVFVVGHEGEDLVEALREVQDHYVAIRPLRQSFFDNLVELVGEIY